MKSNSIRNVGILTSGGDAPGMNAVVRAAVRRGSAKGLKFTGILRGYAGLLNGEMRPLDTQSVSFILERGGTFLESERFPEMEQEAVQVKAVEICRENGLDALIVAGGDGSFRGALGLAKHGFPVIGIPCTIDGDIACSEYTIGFDTAVNTAMHAIDNIRDTASSHERCSMIEVMGRHAGLIALWSGIAGGAEVALIPETYDGNEDRIVERIATARKGGKRNNIIINAEGTGDTASLAKRVGEKGGFDIRATVLSYIQRGGMPTCKDRVFASVMGAKAADLLCEGIVNRVIAYRDGCFVDLDITQALDTRGAMTESAAYMYEILEDLSTL